MKIFVFVVALLLATSAAQADDRSMAIYGDLGRASHGDLGATNLASIGVTLPWTTFEATRSGAWSSYADVFVSGWQAPRVDGAGSTHIGGNDHRRFLQIGALAMWRYRFGQGSSPWFAEAGLGATVMNHIYRRPDREFSTAFQFTEALAIGRSFGQHGRHEVSLRVQHFSNAGIKKPNPGETFAKIRYAYHF